MSPSAALLLVAAAVVAVGFLAGLAGRQLIRPLAGVPRLGLAASTLCGILGGVLGGATTTLVLGVEARHAPVRVILGGLAGTVLVLAVAETVTRHRAVDTEPEPEELIRMGESATVEFKATARFNLHTRVRDPRLELVVATTVAGFFNADGGTLLIGVTDGGTVRGLADDYGLLRRADADGYQLWLHDLLVTTLGAATATQVRIDFPRVRSVEICRVRVPAATKPVFLRAPKQPTTTFVVRTGNSTRELTGQELLAYALGHWSPRRLTAGAGRHTTGRDASPRNPVPGRWSSNREVPLQWSPDHTWQRRSARADHDRTQRPAADGEHRP